MKSIGKLCLAVFAAMSFFGLPAAFAGTIYTGSATLAAGELESGGSWAIPDGDGNLPPMVVAWWVEETSPHQWFYAYYVDVGGSNTMESAVFAVAETLLSPAVTFFSLASSGIDTYDLGFANFHGVGFTGIGQNGWAIFDFETNLAPTFGSMGVAGTNSDGSPGYIYNVNFGSPNVPMSGDGTGFVPVPGIAPVPEPETYAMFLVGLGLLAVRGRQVAA